MFDEFSTRDSLTPPSAPPASSKPAPATPPPPVTPSKVTRPAWLNFIMLGLWLWVSLQLCALSSATDLGLFLEILKVAVLALIIFGVGRGRRMAARALILYCLWAILSALGVGIARLATLATLDTSLSERDLLAFTLLLGMGFSIGFHTLIGLLFALRLRDFPAPPDKPAPSGPLPYVLLLALLFTFSATQVAGARPYLDLQIEASQQSQDLVRGWFGE